MASDEGEAWRALPNAAAEDLRQLRRSMTLLQPMYPLEVRMKSQILRVLRNCRRHNAYPGYPVGAQDIELQFWRRMLKAQIGNDAAFNKWCKLVAAIYCRCKRCRARSRPQG